MGTVQENTRAEIKNRVETAYMYSQERNEAVKFSDLFYKMLDKCVLIWKNSVFYHKERIILVSQNSRNIDEGKPHLSKQLHHLELYFEMWILYLVESCSANFFNQKIMFHRIEIFVGTY